MKKPRILVLLGTRPEVIKLAPVIRELRKRADLIETVLCSTGQHREMLDLALQDFGLVCDMDLGLMTPGQTLASFTSRAFARIDGVLAEVQPAMVIVQGDTTSAMVGAVCGFYRHIPVAHVEAGLRTGDVQSPFPEEVNRCIVSKVAGLHFAPTQRAADNLLREGVAPESIHVSGNTVVDALRWMRSSLPEEAPAELPSTVIAAAANGQRLLLVTIHRRESLGTGIAGICKALLRLVNEFPDCHIVYPMHLNPAVRQVVYETLSSHSRIALLPPVAYATLLWLMQRATLILSDSGGIQEEAPSFGRPLLILRDATERQEVVDAGFARLTGTGEEAIVAAARLFLNDPTRCQQMASRPNPFGDGHAAARITEQVLRHLGLGEAVSDA